MKISIIGAGSLGLLYGYYLADNHEITYYIRNKQQISKLNEHGVRLTGSSKSKKVKAEIIDEYKTSDLIIIALKQTEVSSFIKKHQSILKNKPILFLQNGLGHIEYIKKYNLEAIIAIVEHGAFKKGYYEVSHLGKGSTKIAPYSKLADHSKEKVNKLNHPVLNFINYSDWKQISYEKLVINAVINPLTAIFDIPNGELLKNSHLKSISESLCKEASEILAIDHNLQWQNIIRICTVTSENTSSMRADILSNKQTEIESIVGYLLKQTQFNYPFLEFVYKGVKALEERGVKDE